MSTRRRRRLTAVAVAAIGLVAAPLAWGHAVLERTEPGSDTIVQESPQIVRLHFTEAVDTSLGSIRVLDANGEQVDTGDVERPSPTEVQVGIDGELEKGTYTVGWRVISSDSHPINGAFVFHVQERGANPAGVSVEGGTPTSVEVGSTVVRFFEFAFLLLAVGGVAALIYSLRSADARIHRLLFTVLAVASGALALFALLAIPFQGADAVGTGFLDALDWNVISAVLESRFGKVELARAGLAVGLLVLALLLRRSSGRSRETLLAASAVVAAALVVTPALAGHASTEGALAVAADSAHVLAGSAWVGGLAFVVIALVVALDQRWPLATRVVPRFSTTAVLAVGLLLFAGVISGYLEVRSWSALWETNYGLLLMGKVALVMPLLALGAYNNRYAVPRLRAGVAQPAERRRFMQTASVELAIMVVIVGVTAVLVHTPPAKSEVSAPSSIGPQTLVVTFSNDVQAHVQVEPAAAGPNTLEVHFLAPMELDALSIAASLPEQDIGPLELEAEPIAEGGGGWRAEGDFAIPGTWKLDFEGRQGEFDLITGTTNLEIGGN